MLMRLLFVCFRMYTTPVDHWSQLNQDNLLWTLWVSKIKLEPEVLNLFTCCSWTLQLYIAANRIDPCVSLYDAVHQLLLRALYALQAKLEGTAAMLPDPDRVWTQGKPAFLLLQDHHGSGSAVFWVGIAFWLFFALLPARFLVSLVHKHKHQVFDLPQTVLWCSCAAPICT